MRGLVYVFSLFLFLVSCSENNTSILPEDQITKEEDNKIIDGSVDETIRECTISTVIDRELFKNAAAAPLTILESNISGDCLTLNVGVSGCSGINWEFQLIDSGDIMESLPPQRNIRLSLYNNEVCEAYFVKVLSYDISNLQVEGTDEVLLNLLNSQKQINYSY